MNYGAYLKGGGAKGAFQAGILYALNEKGFKWKVLGGTSIGAINGFFILKNEFEKMKKLYCIDFKEDFMDTYLEGLTVDNSLLEEVFSELKDSEDDNIEAFYVNYIKIENGVPKEVTENIKGMDKKDAIDRVLWSSRLPFNNPRMTYREFIKYMESHDVGKKFEEDIKNHVYDGINLDGGMVNNNFLPEILNHEIDKLFILDFNYNKEEFLKNFKNSNFNKENIEYIFSPNSFKVTDTYEFNPKFLRSRFEEGYNYGKELKIR